MKPSTNPLENEIQARWGFVPPVFRQAQADPVLLRMLWQQTVSGYLDNPLPAIFKDKLGIAVAHDQANRYCLAAHSCALHQQLGAAAVYSWLQAAAPTILDQQGAWAVLRHQSAPLTTWPAPDSLAAEALLLAARVAFGLGGAAKTAHAALRHALAPTLHHQVIGLLGYLHSMQQWTAAYPELAYGDTPATAQQLRALVQAEPRLAAWFDPALAAPLPAGLIQFHPADFEAERLRIWAYIFAYAAWGMAVASPDGSTIMFTNRAFAQLYGMTVSDLVGMPVQQLFVPSEIAALPHHFEQARQHGNHFFPALHQRRDASVFMVHVDVTAVRNEQAAIVYLALNVQNVTERVQAEQTVHFLAEASMILAASLDYRTTLQNVADLIVPQLADACTIDMIVMEPDGTPRLEQAVSKHSDPVQAELMVALRGRYPPTFRAPGPVAQVLRTGQAVLYSTLEHPPEGDSDAPQRLLLDLGFRSFVAVPLVVRGRTLGVLTLASSRPGRHYSQVDLQLAEDLAGRVALAIENTQLYAEAQDAVRRMTESLALLDTLFGAAPVGFGFLDPELRYVRVNEALAEMNGLRPEHHLGFYVQDVLPGIPDETIHQLQTVLRTGEPMINQELAAYDNQVPSQLRYFLISHYPVKTQADDVLGLGVAVIEITDRKQAEEERMQLLASEQAALAAAEMAQARLAFQAQASRVLARSLDFRITLDNVARLAVPFLADWCVVNLREPNGGITALTLAHRDSSAMAHLHDLAQRYPLDPDLAFGVANVLRTGQAELIADLSAVQLNQLAPEANHLKALEALGCCSWLIVPLIVRGETMGAISFTSGNERHYGPDDLALAEDLAQRAATAVDNARLYAEAQEALHARDHFLSLAAHELKTPITSLVGYTQLIQRRAAREGNQTPRDLRAIEAIANQAIRLDRLISVMLDLSRLQLGQLTIERGWVDLQALVGRVVEESHPLLGEHSLTFDGPDEPLMIEGDELRLEQVLHNLMQNAIKYSPKGGLIRVRIEPEAEQIAIVISDQGIGIPQAALSQLFSRFYRVVNVATQQISGQGLGLHVVKEIVTLHHGTIEVASVEGQGSTFTVRLPRHMPPG